jgi:hypothetical protein
LIGAEGAAGPGAIEVRLRGVSPILGSAVVLCLGVILVPAALLALLYVRSSESRWVSLMPWALYSLARSGSSVA